MVKVEDGVGSGINVASEFSDPPGYLCPDGTSVALVATVLWLAVLMWLIPEVTVLAADATVFVLTLLFPSGREAA